MPDPSTYEVDEVNEVGGPASAGTATPAAAPAPITPVATAPATPVHAPLPRRFFLFATSSAASTLGLMTFGIISFHLVDAGLVRTAVVPVVYAAAMASAAVAALVTGFAYDRWDARVLLTLPFLVATVPALALAGTFWVALVGVLVWGAAVGVQESTVKALVADLVPSTRLATAYGVFAAFEGAAALAGGGLAGWLYGGSRADLVVVVAVCQVLSFALLVAVFRSRRRTVHGADPAR
jgi:MFS family permease